MGRLTLEMDELRLLIYTEKQKWYIIFILYLVLLLLLSPTLQCQWRQLKIIINNHNLESTVLYEIVSKIHNFSRELSIGQKKYQTAFWCILQVSVSAKITLIQKKKIKKIIANIDSQKKI